MKTTKARPTKAGTTLSAAERAEVLELAEILKDLGSSPTELLERAMKAEHLLRSSARGAVLPYLREFGALGLYAPSVLAAIVRASTVLSSLPDDMRDGSRTFAEAKKLLLGVTQALFAKHASTVEMDRRSRAREVLSLAQAVQTEAERLARSKPATFARSDGKPNVSAVATARAKLASGAGLSVDALQLRIGRAAEAFPDAAWPEIMPRPPKKRQA
ncbi:MAG TPA: hypothetical protein PK569_14120 [Thermoanaerobaculia bacterium]|nr:hypothetical protein [Thermoanaerobaculia bacterium]